MPIGSGVDGALFLDVAVPRTERVLHEYTEDLGNAEIREVEEVLRLPGPHGVEYRLDTLFRLL